MSLTQGQEDREYELRVEQVETNIDKLRSDLRYEGRKFAVQLFVGFAVSVGAGVALANYVNNRPPLPAPPAPPPQIIYVPQYIPMPAPTPQHP